MPLTMRGNPLNIFRRMGSSNREVSKDASSAAASDDEGGRHGSKGTRRQTAGGFGFTVPDGCSAGQTLRVQGPDGRQVDVVLPPSVRPGQKLRVQMETDGSFTTSASGTSGSGGLAGFDREDAVPTGGGSISDLTAFVRATCDATKASISSMQQRLHDELELQKVLWASAPSASSTEAATGTELTVADARGASHELSQTQAIVFAAAEAGDCGQLLAALGEAKLFSAVSMTLEEAIKNMKATEDALVTWRCLLDALEAKDRDEIEVWLEQCRGLGLEVPAGIKDALAEMNRRDAASDKHFEKCREVHRQLQFALEANDLELMAEIVAEAEKHGLAQLPAAQEAKERLRAGNSTSAKSPPRSRGDSQFSRQSSPTTPAGGGGDAGAGPSREPPPVRVPSPGEGERGPGGLWERGHERPRPSDEPHSYQQPRAPPPKAAEQTDDDPRSVKELLEECKRLGLATDGAINRADLLRIIRNAPRRAPPPQGGPGAPAPGAGAGPSSASSSRQNYGPGSSAPGMGHHTAFGGFGAPGAGHSSAHCVSSAPPANSSVWDRKDAPNHVVSKRSKALWLLGLESGYGTKRLTAADLRTAYRKAAMESHPDKVQNHSREAQAKDLFQEVKASYDYLQTPAAGVVY